jgi:hypothetical protein
MAGASSFGIADSSFGKRLTVFAIEAVRELERKGLEWVADDLE